MYSSKFQIALLGGFLSFLCAVQADVTIVKDGKAEAEIVLPEKPLSNVKLAADDLQKYIELMSGAKLPIVSTPTAEVKNKIYVGESDYTKKLGVKTDDLKVEGFKIIVKDNYAVLAGHDKQYPQFPYDRRDKTGNELKRWQDFVGEKYDVPFVEIGDYNQQLEINIYDATATLYATSDFLELLGVRWYHPYENGTVVPSKTTIIIPDTEIKREPVFPLKMFCFYGTMREDAQGVIWFKRMKYGNSYVIHTNHSIWDIIENPEQKKEHPEYYAKENGKIIPGMKDRGVPKLTDPSFRKTSLNYLNKLIEAYPDLKAVTLGMPDGFTKIDEEDAKIWNRPDRNYEGKFSDYVWDYWLAMAKELKKSHPDKLLLGMAYTTYRELPSNIDKLPDNVAMGMAHSVALLFIPGESQKKKIREEWISKLTSKKLFIWDWYRFYAGDRPRYPVFFTKFLQQDMQEITGKCEGKFIEVAPIKNRIACPGLVHMLHYWQGKLYWNPNADREKIFNEYYELYFGPAKTEMKEFYEFAEDVWMRPESRSVTATSGFLKEADVDKYFEILKRAREKAGAGSVYDKRIEEIETEMQPLKKLFPNLKRIGPDFTGMTTNESVQIDGDLTKKMWTSWNCWYPMKELITGKKDKLLDTIVGFRMNTDKSALLIAVKCKEPHMEKLCSKTTKNDDGNIFEDDVVEVYIETPERSFFKIVVNPNGAVYDESRDVGIIERDTLPVLWNPGVKAAVKKNADSWDVEIMIPTKDFGKLGPSQAFPWGINVCRSRNVSGKPEAFAISPTGKMVFLDLSKLGNLIIK